MSAPTFEAIQAFSSSVCRLGLDFGGLTLEVPRRMFLELLCEAKRLHFAPPAGRIVKIPVLGMPLGSSPSWPRPGGAMSQERAVSEVVEVDEHLLRVGLRLHLHSGPWTIRLKEPDRSELISEFEKAGFALHQGPLPAARLERFPHALWTDGPGGGPYSTAERTAQREHTAKWRAQEAGCTCSYRDGDWYSDGHRLGCPRYEAPVAGVPR